MSQRPSSSGSYAPDLRVFRVHDLRTEIAADDMLTAVQAIQGVRRAEYNKANGRLIVLGFIDEKAVIQTVAAMGATISVETPEDHTKTKPTLASRFSQRKRRRKTEPVEVPDETAAGGHVVPTDTPKSDNTSPERSVRTDGEKPRSPQAPKPSRTRSIQGQRDKGRRGAAREVRRSRAEVAASTSDGEAGSRGTTFRMAIATVVLLSFLTGILLSVIKVSAGASGFRASYVVWGIVVLSALGGIGWAVHRFRPRGGMSVPDAVGDVHAYVVAAVVVLGVGISGSWLEGILAGAFIAVSQYAVAQFSRKQQLNLAPVPVSSTTTWVCTPTDGTETHVSLDNIVTGTVLRLQTGEAVPADGRVLSGEAAVSLEHINDDPIPVVAQTGDALLAGAILRTGWVQMQVDTEPEHSVIRSLRRPTLPAEVEAEALAGTTGRYMRRFGDVVLYVAFAAMIIPLLFLGDALAPWIHRALGLLVLAPATGLVAARTLPVLGAAVRAARLGVGVRSSRQLRRLWRASRLVLLETLLVNPSQYLVEVLPLNHRLSEQQAVQRAASLVSASNSPVWHGLVNACVGEELPLLSVRGLAQVPGRGVEGSVENNGEAMHMMLGPTFWMQEEGVRLPPDSEDIINESAASGGSVLWLSDGTYALAAFVLGKRAWDGSRRFVNRLKRYRFNDVTLVSSGDAPDVERTARQVEITDTMTGLSPESMGKHVADWQAAGEHVISVGTQHDYRTPLHRGHAHIWVGTGAGMPTDAKGITVIDNDPAKVLTLFGLSKTLDRASVAMTALAALGKAVLLVAAFAGVWPLWLLAAVDAGVTGIVLLTAWRLSTYRR